MPNDTKNEKNEQNTNEQHLGQMTITMSNTYRGLKEVVTIGLDRHEGAWAELAVQTPEGTAVRTWRDPQKGGGNLTQLLIEVAQRFSNPVSEIFRTGPERGDHSLEEGVERGLVDYTESGPVEQAKAQQKRYSEELSEMTKNRLQALATKLGMPDDFVEKLQAAHDAGDDN